jgi:hypothetical protein
MREHVQRQADDVGGSVLGGRKRCQAR